MIRDSAALECAYALLQFALDRKLLDEHAIPYAAELIKKYVMEDEQEQENAEMKLRLVEKA